MKVFFIMFLTGMTFVGCNASDTQQGKESFSNKELVKRVKQYNAKKETPKPEYFTASDRVRLAYYSFMKDAKSPSVIVFHGGGAHSTGGYQLLADELVTRHGVNVFLFDLRGHGKSEGRRGDAPSPDRVYRDVKEFITHVRTTAGGRLYFIGHSSGCGLILNYLAWKEENSDRSDDAAGYIFVSPQFSYKAKTARQGRVEFAKVKTWVFVIAGMTNGRIGGNWYGIYLNYPPRVLKENPLLLDRYTRNMSMALNADEPVAQFAAINKPFAIFIGSEDELLDPQKVMAYAEYPKEPIRKNSTAKIIQGAKHLPAIWRSSGEIGVVLRQWIR